MTEPPVTARHGTGAVGVREITDPADPALSDFAGLTDVAARSVREPAAGLFIAEGAMVIQRALAAGMRPRRMLTSPKYYREDLSQALRAAGQASGSADPEVLLAAPELLRAVTGYRVHRGALATFDRPAPLPPEVVLVRAGTLLVLVDLVDHTNVGAIFRNAAALGIAGILLTPRCADPWYRRSVKVSMGAVFAVPWTYLPAGEPLVQLRAAGVATMALSPDPGGVNIADVATATPRALLVGTEGAGLPASIRGGADVLVRIPMAAGVDSLNVSAATAIACHLLGDTSPGHSSSSAIHFRERSIAARLPS